MAERRLSLVQKTVAFAMLFLATFALVPILPAPSGRLLTGVSVLAILLFAGEWRAFEAVVRGNRLLWLLVALTVASTAWSDAPATSLAHGLTLAVTCVAAALVASASSRSELARLLAAVLLVVIVLSIVLALFEPNLGLDHLRGDSWRGAFTTKNELGRVALFALVVWGLRLVTLDGHPVTALAIGLASGYALLDSGSRTALLVLGLLGALLVFLPSLRAHSSIALPSSALALGFAILGGTWLTDHSDAAVSGLGADPTFTGRSEIWSVVWSLIEEHPWLGWGYSAFWRGADGPSGMVWAAIGSAPPHAHNAVLDVWADLGLVGVVLLVGSLSINLLRAALIARREWSFTDLLPVVAFAALALFSVSESTLVPRVSFFWLLYVMLAVQAAEVVPAPVAQLSGVARRPTVGLAPTR